MKQKKRTKIIGNTTAKNRNIRDESMLRRRNSTKSTKRKIKLTPDQQVYMGSIDAKGLEIQYLADYTYALLKNYRRPVAYDYIGQVDDEYDYNKFKYEINKAKYLADPKNQWKLLHIATRVAETYFGCDVTSNYGVAHSYKLKDIPNDKPSKKCEEFLFPYSDEYYQAMLNAPKVPIGPWVTQTDNRECCIKTRKYLINIDGDILIGEITTQQEKLNDKPVPGAGSDIKFCIYFKGREDAKFILDRWDFEPPAAHPNKRDNNGQVSLDGYYPKKTRYSHRHLGTLINRLFATQGQSLDVVPTPLNQNTPEGAEELRYESFDQMLQDFEKTLNIYQDQIPEKEIAKEKSIKKLGRKFCPCYSQQYHQVEEQRPVRPQPATTPTVDGLPSIYDYQFSQDLAGEVRAVRDLVVKVPYVVDPEPAILDPAKQPTTTKDNSQQDNPSQGEDK